MIFTQQFGLWRLVVDFPRVKFASPPRRTPDTPQRQNASKTKEGETTEETEQSDLSRHLFCQQNHATQLFLLSKPLMCCQRFVGLPGQDGARSWRIALALLGAMLWMWREDTPRSLRRRGTRKACSQSEPSESAVYLHPCTPEHSTWHSLQELLPRRTACKEEVCRSVVQMSLLHATHILLLTTRIRFYRRKFRSQTSDMDRRSNSCENSPRSERVREERVSGKKIRQEKESEKEIRSKRARR